jgi:hypothetical protein
MQLFVPGSQEYQARPLDGAVSIGQHAEVLPLAESPGMDEERKVARLVPWHGPDGRTVAALLVRTGNVRVNGREPLPVTVLGRSDEIRVNGVSLFYTDEAPLRVVPFEPIEGQPNKCARCNGPIPPGTPVVHCPVCGLVYMAQPDKEPNCWTYGPCRGCGRDPRAEFVWRPSLKASTVPWYERSGRRDGRGQQESGKKWGANVVGQETRGG